MGRNPENFLNSSSPSKVSPETRPSEKQGFGKIRRRGLALLGASLILIWLGGFLSFVSLVESYVEPVLDEKLAPAEAIVVLTGGSERLEAGYRLLAAGKGQKLLISGVAHGVQLRQILAKEDLSEDLKTCCVTLGYQADNTIGNAEETKQWLKDQGFSTIILVTAHYHMPRSLLFFAKSLPSTQLIPYPVSPDSVRLDQWWGRIGTASLLFLEYNKYVFARIRMLWGAL